MRIAIVAEHYDPLGGGAERSIDQIARELVRRGHDVTILAGYGPDTPFPPQPTVLFCPTGKPRGGWRLMRFASWVARKLNGRDYDTSLSITTAAAAHVVQPRSGIVREFQLRNIARRSTGLGRWTKRAAITASPKQRALRRLEARTMSHPRVQRFVAISRYVREQMRSHFNIPEDRIALIPNAVVMPNFTDDEHAFWRSRLRHELGIPGYATLYLFVSHNPLLKGVSPLMSAFARLSRRAPDTSLIIVGSWSYSLERLAQRTGVRSRVRFLGQTNRIAPLYCAADVAVLPTYFDPASKVILEALAMGVPAITTRYNGAGDFVHGEDGLSRGRLIDEPDDIRALADAMVELADPRERQRCQAATAGLADTLSMRRHVEQLEAVLTDAAG